MTGVIRIIAPQELVAGFLKIMHLESTFPEALICLKK